MPQELKVYPLEKLLVFEECHKNCKKYMRNAVNTGLRQQCMCQVRHRQCMKCTLKYVF